MTRLRRKDVVLARTHYPTGTPCPLTAALMAAGAHVATEEEVTPLLTQRRLQDTNKILTATARLPAPSQHDVHTIDTSAAQLHAAAVRSGGSDETAASASHLSQEAPLQNLAAASMKSQGISRTPTHECGWFSDSEPKVAPVEETDAQTIKAALYGWRMPLQLARLVAGVHRLPP